MKVRKKPSHPEENEMEIDEQASEEHGIAWIEAGYIVAGWWREETMNEKLLHLLSPLHTEALLAY